MLVYRQDYEINALQEIESNLWFFNCYSIEGKCSSELWGYNFNHKLIETNKHEYGWLQSSHCNQMNQIKDEYEYELKKFDKNAYEGKQSLCTLIYETDKALEERNQIIEEHTKKYEDNVDSQKIEIGQLKFQLDEMKAQRAKTEENLWRVIDKNDYIESKLRTVFGEFQQTK